MWESFDFDVFSRAGDALGGAPDWAASQFGRGGASGFVERLFAGEANILSEVGAFFRHGGGVQILEDLLQIEAYNRFSGHAHKKYDQNWRKTVSDADAHFVAASETAINHALIAEQLRIHARDSEAAKAYEALGLKLPNDALLQQAKNRIFSKIHPDKGGDTKLSQRVNAAIDHLKDTDKTREYEKLVESAEGNQKLKQRLTQFFTDIADKQTGLYEQAEHAARLALPFSGKSKEGMGAAERISKTIHDGFAKQGNFGKGAIVLGASVGVAAAVYGVAKWAEKRNNTKKNKTNNSFIELVGNESKKTQAVEL